MMKNKTALSAAVILIVLQALLTISCGTILPPRYAARVWTAGKNEKAAVRLASVTVDKIGEAASVEREAALLAPLYIGQNGYRFAGDGSAADYTAGIILREREYASGWKTIRSLSAEARFYSEDTLLAASRVSASGDITLASSDVLARMISTVLKKGFRALEKSENEKTEGER